jgi:nucleolar MIF4G domain-containing protein 1
MNSFLHFFLFSSLTSKLIFDLINDLLLDSYTEVDIEILIFLLHNIGLNLRKEDPVGLRDLISRAEQKRSALQV